MSQVLRPYVWAVVAIAMVAAIAVRSAAQAPASATPAAAPVCPASGYSQPYYALFVCDERDINLLADPFNRG